MSLFEAVDITVKFGTVVANDGVSIRVPEHSLVGLIGPNGAGKTTFIDAVTGFVPSAGKVMLNGRDISSLPAHKRSRAGLTRTWQSVDLFADLTIAENLLVAAEELTVGSVLRDVVRPRRGSKMRDQMLHRLEAVGLREAADMLPSELSTGQRNLAGVARALVARAPFVLLDEPGAGLDTQESEELGARLRSLVDGGDTILLVDHDMSLVLSVCDLIYVLDFGRIIAVGTPSGIRVNPRVIDAYLGESDEEPATAPAEELEVG